MTDRPDRSGVILAGGASRRMGVDKAFVEIDGEPMVSRVAAALADGGCTEIECQGGDRRRLETLGLGVVEDLTPGEGPVPAIAQAVGRHAGTVVIVACDLPDLDGQTVAAVATAVDDGAPAAVASTGVRHLVVAFPGGRDQRLDPEAWQAGSVRGLLAAVGAVDVPVAQRVVRNVNRPDDVS